ncbi:MAG: recombinase [Alphaproteobacteria bacterium]|nr:recombinase [Alphaproteobacteria bacterium]MBU1830971.1 recombinase [Alphaproteobacteria bacterium]
MIGFNKALKDGSDPSYAPGLSWSKRNASWKAPKKYAEAGYEPARVPLNMPGEKGDEHRLNRAAKCRALTAKMLDWWSGQDQSGWDVQSWSYVIHRFLTDDVSPYADVKSNTQEGYRYSCGYWKDAIGHLNVADMGHFEIRSIEKAMKANGRSIAFIHRMFTMLRGLTTYAVLLRIKGAIEVQVTLSNTRISTPPKSSYKPSRAQVEAVVAKADASGDVAFAAGLLIQFEFALRAVDVRGQWFDISEEEFKSGGIVRKSKREGNVIYSRWQDGLCIEHFDPEMTLFRKVISKTARSQPEPLSFPLSGVPNLRERLLELRGDRRMGPLIVTKQHGLPFDRNAWARVWRKHASAAGIPSEIKLKDVRAGALTEAEQMGAKPRLLQAAGQHANFATTERYLRNQDDRIAQVIDIRNRGKTA